MAVERRRGMWGALAALAVATAVVAAAIQLGSPSERRLRRLDEKRVASLRQLASEIQEQCNRDGKLPATLTGLARQPWVGEVERDPESRQAYGYEPRDDRHYRLCAEFSRASPEPRPTREPDFWRHPAGRHCFELEVKQKKEDG